MEGLATKSSDYCNVTPLPQTNNTTVLGVFDEDFASINMVKFTSCEEGYYTKTRLSFVIDRFKSELWFSFWRVFT